MPMKPGKDESQSDFMKRCMSETFGADAPEDRTQEQAVAICMGYWRDAKGGEKPKSAADEIARIIARYKKIVRDLEDLPAPEPGESRSEFLDRCIEEMVDKGMEEGDAEEACRVSYEEQGGDEFEEESVRTLVHKEHTTDGGGTEFILSDATPDRFGDIIEPTGWEFKNFLRNPVALFNHKADFVIGTWRGVRADDKALRGELILAPEGTSDRIDEIRRLVQHGILRAVSVGFKPIKSEPIKEDDDGFFSPKRYRKQELVETSLVSIPANPNALAVVKSLHISPETEQLVFGKHATNGHERRPASSTPSGKHAKTQGADLTGKHAVAQPHVRGQSMSLLAQRIEQAQTTLAQWTNELNELLEKMGEIPNEESEPKLAEITGKIESGKRMLANLEKAEKQLGNRAEPSRDLAVRKPLDGDVLPPVHQTNGRARPFSVQSKKVSGIDWLVKSGCAQLYAHRYNRPVEMVIEQLYPNDDATKAFLTEYVLKAAVSPAMTSVTGWAAELVQQVNADFMDTLHVDSIFPRLSAAGITLNFGRAGKISIPTRNPTPTIAGSFVGEGQPIPVRQGSFGSVILVPKKMGVITTFTREISEHSIPAIEGLLRSFIQDDTAVSLDSVLIDINAATAIRPAGIRNGVSGLTATTGGGFNALVGDIKNLTGAILTATAGNIRRMTWLMNPQQALSISLTANAQGVFPFREEINAGRLNGFPVIQSGTVPLGTVIVLDAADFVSVGEAPRFEVSDQATIHEEDTTPLPIVSGTPGTAASPVRSMFQTDSLALRLILPVNWALRRTGMVSWVSGVTW